MNIVKRILASAATLVIMAVGSIALAPPAEAIVQYGNGCRAWFTFSGAAGKCDRLGGAYRIEPLCKWWVGGGTAYVPGGVYTYAPYTSSRSCPVGSRATGAILYAPAYGNLAYVVR